MELKTPLYDCHLELRGKMVAFGGYLLPVQYETGVIKEHLAVRTKAGIFDVSHMGEIRIHGKDALTNVQNLGTNDFSKMKDGQIKYSLMCNETGGVVDDLLVYRMGEEDYFIVVNAANHHKDVKWMKKHLTGEAVLTDLSDEIAQVALQGPLSYGILRKIAKEEDIPGKYYTFVNKVFVAGIECLISKTGYTGEEGYEIYCSPSHVSHLWNALLENGKELGLLPAGLGARDTLRLEASMPLYGHELSEEISPLEAGLDFAVKMGKPNFIGKKGIEERGAIKKKRVGLKMLGRGIAREECFIYREGEMIGVTTSGTHCPYLNHAYAMGILNISYIEPGMEVEIEVRGRIIKAEVVPLPFYKK